LLQSNFYVVDTNRTVNSPPIKFFQVLVCLSAVGGDQQSNFSRSSFAYLLLAAIINQFFMLSL